MILHHCGFQGTSSKAEGLYLQGFRPWKSPFVLVWFEGFFGLGFGFVLLLLLFGFACLVPPPP